MRPKHRRVSTALVSLACAAVLVGCGVKTPSGDIELPAAGGPVSIEAPRATTDPEPRGPVGIDSTLPSPAPLTPSDGPSASLPTPAPAASPDRGEPEPPNLTGVEGLLRELDAALAADAAAVADEGSPQ